MPMTIDDCLLEKWKAGRAKFAGTPEDIEAMDDTSLLANIAAETMDLYWYWRQVNLTTGSRLRRAEAAVRMKRCQKELAHLGVAVCARAVGLAPETGEPVGEEA